MAAFHPLVAAAVEVFYRTHLVVVHCRHGKHRSVVVGRAVEAFTGARLWCPCISTPFSPAIPPEALWYLLDSRLQAHVARCGRIPFPVLDFTNVKWTYTRARVLSHLDRHNARFGTKWTEDDLCMLRTATGQGLVLC